MGLGPSCITIVNWNLIPVLFEVFLAVEGEAVVGVAVYGILM